MPTTPTAVSNDLHIVKTELYDPNVMDAILRSKGVFADADLARLRKYRKDRSGPNSAEVVYHYAKGYEKAQLGRLYVQGNKGLQSFPHDIRNPLLENNYWDVDMENCHYVLAAQLGAQWRIRTDAIQHYCDNRDACLAELGDNRRSAKTAFLKVMYGGNIKLYSDGYHDDNIEHKSNTLSKIEGEVKALMNFVWGEYTQYHYLVKRKPNQRASLLALVLQEEEKKCIRALDLYLATQGRSMDILIHDGGEVRKLEGEVAFPEALLRGGEDAIAAVTGYKMTLAVKSFKHGFQMPATTVQSFIGGIPSDKYADLKAQFEEQHFYNRATNTVCEVNDTGVEHFLVKHASTAFAGKYQHSYTSTAGELKQHDLLSPWLLDSERKMYERMVFRPGGSCLPTEYNTYQGFAAASLPLSDNQKLDKALEYLKEIILNLGNNEMDNAKYILMWIADLFQHPGTRPGVALILSGPQGVGKDTLGSLIGRIVGKKYYGHFDDAENQLFGAFNSQLEDKLFIHLEELQGFSTRKNSSKLKALITKDDMLVNHKGVIPYQKDVFYRFFATTNEAIPVKVEQGDRRFAIFFAGDKNKGNHAYWKDVNEVFQDRDIHNGMLEFFLSINLDGWNARDIVETEEKRNLQENEVNYEEQFLIYVATNTEDETAKYSNDDFYKEYVAWCKVQALMPNSKNHFGRLLTSYITKNWMKTGKSGSARYVIVNCSAIRGTFTD